MQRVKVTLWRGALDSEGTWDDHVKADQWRRDWFTLRHRSGRVFTGKGEDAHLRVELLPSPEEVVAAWVPPGDWNALRAAVEAFVPLMQAARAAVVDDREPERLMIRFLHGDRVEQGVGTLVPIFEDEFLVDIKKRTGRFYGDVGTFSARKWWQESDEPCLFAVKPARLRHPYE